MQGNIRIKKVVDADTLRLRAATSTMKFIRRQAELSMPQSRDELIRGIWRIYFKLRRNKLLAAPKTTRRLLRRTYGYWTAVGVYAV